MPAHNYSGGRLLALTMAEALATTGTQVDFVLNQYPRMHREFGGFSKVRIVVAEFDNLSRVVDPGVDVVVIVPEQGEVTRHSEFVRHAIECHAKIVLLNFETPDWFNSLSPFERDPALWEGWDLVSIYADLILSISGESRKWARRYYKHAKPNCKFDYCYPAINSVVADSAPAMSARLKQIVMLTRIDPHKGFAALEAFAHPDFAGYKILVCVGDGAFAPDMVARWKASFAAASVEFQVVGRVSELDKFTMLKSSALLYFPSHFEGFGLPPLEAAYCLLPTVCSDLPVLREFGRKAFFYCDPADPDDIRRAAKEALAPSGRLMEEHPRIAKIARLRDCGMRLSKILRSLN